MRPQDISVAFLFAGLPPQANLASQQVSLGNLPSHLIFRGALRLLLILSLVFGLIPGFEVLPLQSQDLVWVEDSVPMGATGVSDWEGWNWVSSNPPPFSGAVAHQSSLVSGVHQHYFYNATSTLAVNAGDVLVAYIYLDPANPPSQVMLQWNDGNWEHRAYWGANQIPWGVDGTNSRRLMGALPAAGQWVRLEVPASLVGLEGRTLNGMAFSLFNGRATWDRAGKRAASSSGPVTMRILAHPAGSKNENFRIEATGFSVFSLPDVYRVYGTSYYQQLKWGATGQLESLLFGTAGYPDIATLNNRSDCAHVKDPRVRDPRCGTDVIGYFWKRIGCPPSSQIACQDNDRWNGSPGRYNITPFPTPGVWPRSDDFGTTNYAPIIDPAKVNAVPLQPADTSCTRGLGDTIWLEDVLPRGATAVPDSDGWTWVSPNVSAFPGRHAHTSIVAPGIHQHYFLGASSTLAVATGDVLIAYVFLDPVNTPREVMLQWNDGTWEHRAYWGENLIGWGTNDTNSRRFMGPLPPAGTWVRLEVPAALVGLEGRAVNGMAFTLFGGKATWDHAGKFTPAPGSPPPGPCPPKTGRPPADSFHAYNPDDFATATANAKAVQVQYADGSTRWLMAFNSMIKYTTPTYINAAGNKVNDSFHGTNAADNWRVLWATSPDGVTWTVHPQILFRSINERHLPFTGLLLTDAIVDNGYFYVLFQDLLQPHLYLARCRIDPINSASTPGYIDNANEGWSVAARINGQYGWKRLPLGQQIDFVQLGAEPVMKSLVSPGGAFVKQASIARIFQSSTPGSASRIFGVTVDDDGSVQLWSTPDLSSQPFTYESNLVIDPSVTIGGNGWEFGFSHYRDNNAATPRIIATGFEVWVAESPSGAFHSVVTRRNARLTNF